MIQFYDDRPSDPIEAFFYFDTIFRNQFLSLDEKGTPKGALSTEDMHNYMMRLLVAKRELFWKRGHSIQPEILPKWNLPLGSYVIENFDEEMFLRFQRDVDSSRKLWKVSVKLH